MFTVVAEPRKRRVCPPRAVAASVVFHLLLLAGVAAALSNTAPQAGGFFDPAPFEPPAQMHTAPRTATPRPRLHEPAPVTDRAPQSEAPANEPSVPPPNLNLLPAMPEQYSDGGTMAGAIGTPDTAPPSTVATVPSAEHDGGPMIFSEVLDGDGIALDTPPELSDQRQARLILQRSYPPLLRDIGATGRTVVQLIIGRDGRVEPGSVRVRESTDRAFDDAAIRAAERFRFKPATVHGRRVAVLVTIPIVWRLED